VTECNTLPGGVRVSRTLIPDNRFQDIPVRIMNVRSQPVTIPAGANVANLQSWQIIGRMPTEQSTETRIPGETKPSAEVPEFVQDLVNKVDATADDDVRQSLTQLLLEHQDAFSQSDNDIGCTGLVTHTIDTGDSRPIRQRLRRYPPAHVEVISQQVDDLLSQGVIEPTSSPWASNLVLVRKKDGSYRCCVDYRQLNAVTRKDAYPLPRIDSCLDAMANTQWFSTFDLRSSYHQVRVDDEDLEKTAFICSRGMYKFKTMPFGLCNAGATFQRLMDVVMSGLHFHVCLIYLDDIIVFSQTTHQHFERLILVLERLRSAGLKLKPQKCLLFQRSVVFLGHVISKDGIATDPDKTRAVTEWPVPRSLRDVRAFLGLAGYYRRFVEGFAAIAGPLHSMLGKGGKFKWTQEAQESFLRLKSALTNPPVLAMPQDEGGFILDTDASDTAIGAVLSQKQGGMERVIAYASRRLDRRETNYCVTRKELLAVVHFMKYFRQYLLGRTFVVRTDCSALTWLRRTPDPVGQQARWLEVMEEYQFSIEHRSGVRHANADALSRHPCKRLDCACHDPRRDRFTESSEERKSEGGINCHIQTVAVAAASTQGGSVDDGESKPFIGEAADHICESLDKDDNKDKPTGSDAEDQLDSQICRREDEDESGNTAPSSTDLPWSLEGLKAAQSADQDISIIVGLLGQSAQKPTWEDVALLSHDVKVLWQQWPRLAIKDGLLKRRFEAMDGSSQHWQVVLPRALRVEFLELAHGGMTGGHFGRRRTAAVVQSRVYWPSWSSDVNLCIKRCEPCARYHRGAIPRRARLKPFSAGEPWERVSIDITGPHPRSSKQNQFILTCVDHFSKWAEAIPLPNHTAVTVSRALMVHVFCRFGAPRQLLSDRGPEFESELFSNLMRWMEIDKLRTTAYQPSTNGAVERFHRTLNAMLGKVVSVSQRDWDERLPAVMAAYRATPHESTGYSPNRLFLGREVRMPLDVVMGLPAEERGNSSVDDYVYQMQETLSAAYDTAREHLRSAAERRKDTYDIKVREKNLDVGDWVWYWYPRKFTGRSFKWQRSYAGPYLIVRKIEPVNFVIQKSQKAKPFVVHANKLKKCMSVAPVSWLESPGKVATEDVQPHCSPGSASIPNAPESDSPDVATVIDCVEDAVVQADENLPSRRRRPPRYLSNYIC